MADQATQLKRFIRVVFKEFSKGRYGVSTALSTLLFVVMSICGYWLIKTMHGKELES